MKRVWTHPVPIAAAIVFELYVGLLLYVIATVVYRRGDFFAVNAWGPTLVCHPAALIANNTVVRVLLAPLSITDVNVFGPAVSLSLFGGAQWYFLGVFAVFVYRRFYGRPRQDTPRCSCGYSLTGNVSGICSECGTPIPERVWKEIAAKEANVESTRAVPEGGQNVDPAPIRFAGCGDEERNGR